MAITTTAIAAPEPDDDRTRRITRADRLRRRGLPVPDDTALVEFRQRVGRRPHPVAADVAAWMNMTVLVVSPSPPVEDEPEPAEPTDADFELYRRALVECQRGTPSAVTALAVWVPPRKTGLATLAGRAYFRLHLEQWTAPIDPRPFLRYAAWVAAVVLAMQMLIGGRG